MQLHHKRVRSWGAITLGSLFFVAALVLLFWNYVEAKSLRGFSQSDFYILISFFAAYASGHFMVTSAERSVGGVLRPFAFAALFVISTAICVAFSAGRTAETFASREALATHDTAKRLEQEGRVVTSKRDAEGAKAAYDRAQSVADEAVKAAAECTKACVTMRKAAETAAANAKALYERYEKADAWHRTQVVRLDSSHTTAPTVANANLKQIDQGHLVRYRLQRGAHRGGDTALSAVRARDPD